jgi:hypothetical protein
MALRQCMCEGISIRVKRVAAGARVNRSDGTYQKATTLI